jgi:delta(3,5)-delta(2,4)-dienoyl-CoA isomerase
MNWIFFQELRQVFDALSKDGDCRAIVVSGTGKAFSAGLDIRDPDNMPPHGEDGARRALKFMTHVKAMQEGISAIELCLKPTIAVVHGAVIGGAIDLIAAVDVRLCSEDAVFCIKEVKIGLAADIGTLARLPRIVGNDSVIRELALTGRNFKADEARSIGLVSRVLPTKENAIDDAAAVATAIAENSPVAVVGTKRNLNYARDHTVQECLDYVSIWNAAMLQTDDVASAMAASMQKAKPQFSKL